MDNTLIRILKDSGFNDKESEVYLTLLELSSGSVNQISKKTGLKCPIIYVVLKSLIKKGVVSQTPDTKVKKYQSLDVGILLQQARLHAKNIAEMLPIFQTLHNKGKKRPKVHYIDSKEGMVKIYDEMMASNESFLTASYKGMQKNFPGDMERWVKNFVQSRFKTKGKYLVPNTPEDIRLAKIVSKLPNQQVKIASGFEEMNIHIAVFDNKLAVTFFEDGPFMVLIESEGVYESMRPILELMWLGAREI